MSNLHLLLLRYGCRGAALQALVGPASAQLRGSCLLTLLADAATVADEPAANAALAVLADMTPSKLALQNICIAVQGCTADAPGAPQTLKRQLPAQRSFSTIYLREFAV